MLTPTNISILLYTLPIYQLLFYSIQLSTLHRLNPSRRFLGLLLIIMTLFLILNALYQLGISGLMTRFYPFFIPLFLAILPVFYLYVFSLTHEKKRIKLSSKLVLFIPVIMVLAANLIIVNTIPVHNLKRFLVDDNSLFTTDIMAADSLLIILWLSVGLVLFVQIILAVYNIFKSLQHEKATILRQPSHLAYLNFKWIYIISASVFVFVLASACWLLFIESSNHTNAIIFNVIMLLSGGLTGYFGMKQNYLLTEVSGVGPLLTTIETLPERVDYEDAEANNVKKMLTNEESEDLMLKITDFMEQRKPFLEKRFCIADLSKLMDIKQNKITYVINDVMDKNFYGLINEYRVREVIHIVENDNYNYTIDSIAEKVGFHSRSSFYACFKKYTGQTPKEFISNIKPVNYK